MATSPHAPARAETAGHPTADMESGSQVARLDELLGQAAEAAGRLAAGNAEQEARAQYTARISWEAQAEPIRQARAQAEGEAEAEL